MAYGWLPVTIPLLVAAGGSALRVILARNPLNTKLENRILLILSYVFVILFSSYTGYVTLLGELPNALTLIACLAAFYILALFILGDYVVDKPR